MRLFAIAFILLVRSASADLYLVGNSLTADALIHGFDGPTQIGTTEWYIDCGRNLQYIRDNESAATCVGSSRLWSDALANASYDFISFQPYTGTTLSQDVANIHSWMGQQPDASVIIHTGWAPLSRFSATQNGGFDGTNMTPSPEYFAALISSLQALNPGRSILSSRVNDAMESIRLDIANGDGPYSNFAQLYRDDLHLSLAGQYLAHHSIREIIGQAPAPDDRQLFRALTTEEKSYLLSKVAAVPETSSLGLVTLFGLLAICGQAVKCRWPIVGQSRS